MKKGGIRSGTEKEGRSKKIKEGGARNDIDKI